MHSYCAWLFMIVASFSHYSAQTGHDHGSPFGTRPEIQASLGCYVS
jgi:hypothetical protein